MGNWKVDEALTHDVSPAGHVPLEMRLFLPESRTGDPERLRRAGVPEDKQHALTKGEIALELPDRVRSECLPSAFRHSSSGARFRGRAAQKKALPSGLLPLITLPSIRRALQRLPAPVAGNDCPYCRPVALWIK